MSPLVALLLFGFMFVIALSLTIWAALTLRDQSRLDDETPPVAYVPLGASRPVWRRDENDSKRLGGIERRSHASAERANGRRSTDPPERRTGLPPVVAKPMPRPVTPKVRAANDDRRAEGKRAESSRVDGKSTESSRVEGKRAASKRAETPRAETPRAGSGRDNDEYRGARATVTQRPNNDDAFERFLENERD